MGTSVLRCKLCREYYREFFNDKRSMRFLARLHKGSHENDNAEATNSTEGKGLDRKELDSR